MLRPELAGRKFAVATAAIALFAALGSVQAADLSLPVTGELLGRVVDNTGVPQLGAAVQLFNKYQRLIGRAATNAEGRFAFTGLPADQYSVRVSLPTFLPASRDRVLVKPGVDSVLEIHLATLLSSIEIRYQVPTGGMSDDWKWALRSSPRTRLITRVLPEDFPEQEPKMKPHVFSGTHAMLSLSGGDGGLLDLSEMAPDLGTSFAVSTNVFGKNQVQVAGTLGQSAEFGPSSIALCAIYSRPGDALFASAPEITFRMAQLGGFGGQLSEGAPASLSGVGLPMLRTMAIDIYQSADPLEMLHVEYGATSETVEYAQHINRLSPYARMTADLGRAGSIVATYSDGGRPYELLAHQQSAPAADITSDDLAAPIENLSHLPAVSERGGRLELERTENYEVGYQKVEGGRTYAVSGFYEHVWNGRLGVAGDLSALDTGDLFSDGLSRLSSYNVGRYNRSGYLASVDQRLNNNLNFVLAYARIGGFNADLAPLTNEAPGALLLSEKMHNVASVGGKSRIPALGTHIAANYGWVDAQAAIPRHLFTTQNTTASPGLNIIVRQPLPSFFGMPGHLELTADLRNLLAQGYAPAGIADGHRLLLVETPRAIRGGLKITF